MRFRLENGSVVVLEDDRVELCQLFQQFHDQVQVFVTLDETLRESPYKKIRTTFIDRLKHVLHTTTGVDRPTEEQIRQLGNPDSALSQALKQELATGSEDENQWRGCLEYVHINIDRLLYPIVHRLRFLKDHTMLAVIEYLNIASSRRSNTMFEALPFSYQGCDPQTDFRTLVDACLHPYLDFIEKLGDDMLMELTRASLQLGIPSLTQLIGCRMAKLVNTLTEREIRQRFNMTDDKFVHATKEKLDLILKRKDWLSEAPFVSKNQSSSLPPPAIPDAHPTP